MSAQSTLILVGILVILAPFLGVPSAWYTFILPVLGLIVLAIGVLLRARHTKPTTSQVAAHDEPLAVKGSAVLEVPPSMPHDPSPVA